MEDAMRLKDIEIERMQREAAEIVTLFNN